MSQDRISTLPTGINISKLVNFQHVNKRKAVNTNIIKESILFQYINRLIEGIYHNETTFSSELVHKKKISLE